MTTKAKIQPLSDERLTWLEGVAEKTDKLNEQLGVEDGRGVPTRIQPGELLSLIHEARTHRNTNGADR